VFYLRQKKWIDGCDDYDELHNLYSSPDIIRQVKSRRMRWAGHVARMGEERKVYKVLVGKPEGKRPLGRPRRRWEDGIRMCLRETGLGGCGLDSTASGQGPMAGCCECGDEPSGSCATELVISRYQHFWGYYCLCFHIAWRYYPEGQNRIVHRSWNSKSDMNILHCSVGGSRCHTVRLSCWGRQWLKW
jgi:hypothetical protein